MNNNFSKNLKHIRKDNNLSQEQLAEQLGVSRQSISKWESNQAYPEMDKILEICKIFNLNIDDLLTKNIKEIKQEKQSKINISKYLDDFLDFVTKTINMFSSMNFKTKIKCLFEQIFITLILIVIFLIIGHLFSRVFLGIFAFLPSKGVWYIRNFLESIYYVIVTISIIFVLVHIFKVRYLNYYNEYKESLKENSNKEPIEKDNLKNKTFIKEEPKIVIRDPKDSKYKFTNGLAKIIIWFIKFFAFLILFGLSFTLIIFAVAFMASFLVLKSGMFFIGLLISIVSIIVINIIFLLILLNFIFNRKTNLKIFIYLFIGGILFLGIGLGLSSRSLVDFKIISKEESEYYELKTYELKMTENLFIDNFYDIEYIETNNKNIKLEYLANNLCSSSYKIYQDEIIIHNVCTEDKLPELIKLFITLFNKKEILNPADHDLYNIKIYTSKENITKLKENYNKRNFQEENY